MRDGNFKQQRLGLVNAENPSLLLFDQFYS